MNADRIPRSSAEHRKLTELMPWYVNGTISEADRERVDLHLKNCAACRHELLQERHVHQQMSTAVGVEYLSAPSLKRLQAKLDELETRTPLSVALAAVALRGDEPSRGRRLPWSGRLAASAAVMAVALSLAAGIRWMPRGAGASQPAYHTVTTAVSRAPDEVIRAVFSPTITLIEMQRILEEARLRIISGPTEAGIYSLAATSTLPVDSSLETLRRHATVRFAESTQPLHERAVGPGIPR